MAVKKITYKEPSSYFTPAMMKAADEYEKKQAAKEKTDKGGKNEPKKK